MNVLVEVNTAVRKLAELSSLLDLCETDGLSAGWRSHSVGVCVHVPLRRSHFNVSSVIPLISSFHPTLISNNSSGLTLIGRAGYLQGKVCWIQDVPAASSAF